MPELLALTRREFVRFLRQPSRVVASVATPLLIWLFLASGFARDVAGAGPAGYGAHLAPGIIAGTVMFASIFAAISLIEDRNEGFLQGVLVTPTPRWALVGSKVLGGGLLAVAQAALLLPLALVVVGTPPAGTALALLTGLLACSLTAFLVTGLSLALAWRINSTAGFHGVMNAILMPMWFLSGAFFPLSQSAGWMRTLALASPLTWTSESLRLALTGATQLALPPLAVWGGAASLTLAAVVFAGAVMGRPSARA